MTLTGTAAAWSVPSPLKQCRSLSAVPSVIEFEVCSARRAIWQRDRFEILYMPEGHNRVLTVGRRTVPGNQYRRTALYIYMSETPTRMKRVVVSMSVASS
jgi:hypothetical protein